MATKEGHELAEGTSVAPDEYYDAVSANPEDAADRQYREAVSRREAAVRARLGF